MEENDSLNGRGDLLNDILSDEGLGIIARYWTESEIQGTFPLSDIVKNEFNNAGKPEYVILETNSTVNPIFSDDLIEGSTEAYAETPLKEKHTFSGDISVLSGVGQLNDFKSQVVIGGSSIMFSDIEEPLFNSSWYEVADNAKLWKNIISWLAEESQEEETDVPLSELFAPFFIGIISISVVFIIGGILTFNIGSGKEIQVTKSTLPDKVEKKPKKGKESEGKIEKKKSTKKLSKRDRRLQQIKKRKK
jgi:hypothetical protein